MTASANDWRHRLRLDPPQFVGEWALLLTHDPKHHMGSMQSPVPAQMLELADWMIPLAVQTEITELMRQDGPTPWMREQGAKNFLAANLENPETVTDFMFGGKGAGRMFTALVEALAVMSFTIGGVQFMGIRYESIRWGSHYGINGGKDVFLLPNEVAS